MFNIRMKTKKKKKLEKLARTCFPTGTSAQIIHKKMSNKLFGSSLHPNNPSHTRIHIYIPYNIFFPFVQT